MSMPLMELTDDDHGPAWQQDLDQTWTVVQESEDGTLNVGQIVRAQHRRRRLQGHLGSVRRGMVGDGVQSAGGHARLCQDRLCVFLTARCGLLLTYGWQVRYLYVAVDMSRAMADTDLRCASDNPSRA